MIYLFQRSSGLLTKIPQRDIFVARVGEQVQQPANKFCPDIQLFAVFLSNELMTYAKTKGRGEMPRPLRTSEGVIPRPGKTPLRNPE